MKDFKWEECTYYKVFVSLFPGNPYHESILYSGFLTEKGEPGGYSCYMNPTYEEGKIKYDSRRSKIIEIIKLYQEGTGFTL